MPGSISDNERKNGAFEEYRATVEDYALYATYSVFRLRLLSFFGDPVAKRVLDLRKDLEPRP